MTDVNDVIDKSRRGPRGPAPITGPDTSAGSSEGQRPRRPTPDTSMQVRAADLEPYIGLRYLSRLFKLMAVILILLLVSEVITGLVTNGLESLVTLLGEVSRLVVFAGLLWGSGDLAILLIDIGHDLRAARILIGRQLAHHTEAHHAEVDPGIVRRVTPAEVSVEPLVEPPAGTPAGTPAAAAVATTSTSATTV